MYALRSTNSAALSAPHARIRATMPVASRLASSGHTRAALSNGGEGSGFTSDRNPIARDPAASELQGGFVSAGSAGSSAGGGEGLFNMGALRRRIQNVQMWSSPGLMLERVAEARDERPELPVNVMTLKEALDGRRCLLVFVCVVCLRVVVARAPLRCLLANSTNASSLHITPQHHLTHTQSKKTKHNKRPHTADQLARAGVAELPQRPRAVALNSDDDEKLGPCRMMASTRGEERAPSMRCAVWRSLPPPLAVVMIAPPPPPPRPPCSRARRHCARARVVLVVLRD